MWRVLKTARKKLLKIQSKGVFMNPAFFILIILGAILSWFLLSFAFFTLGRFFYGLWKDAKDQLNRNSKDTKKGDEVL